MARLPNLLTLICLIFLLTAVRCKGYMYVKNGKIYDQDGGERIFHGVNVVTKVPPYYDAAFVE